MEKVNVFLLFSSMIIFALIFGITSYNISSSIQTLFILTCSGILFGMFFGFILCWLRTQKKDGKFRKEPYFFALLAILLMILITWKVRLNFSPIVKIYFCLAVGVMGFVIGACWISISNYIKKGVKIGNYEIKDFLIIILGYLILSNILKVLLGGALGAGLAAVIAVLIVTLIHKWITRKNKSKNL